MEVPVEYHACHSLHHHRATYQSPLPMPYHPYSPSLKCHKSPPPNPVEGGGGTDILVIDYSCFFLQQPGEETEERENLAQMAAEAVAAEGEEEDESVLRKYSKGISHVESLLALDRLRQVNPSCST